MIKTYQELKAENEQLKQLLYDYYEVADDFFDKAYSLIDGGFDKGLFEINLILFSMNTVSIAEKAVRLGVDRES